MDSDTAGMKAWNGPGDAPKAGARSKRSAVYLALIVVAVVVVVAVFVTVFVLPGRAHTPAPSGTVLVPSGHSYDVFGGQWSAVSFSLASTQTLRGAFSTTFGITAYVMTNIQYQQFVHSVNVTGYQWASGEVHAGTLDDSLPPGSWDLAFIDLNAQSTSVLITTPVTIG
ncbi:MAG: hypothetical protein L3K18_03115 [Thermoplasmata archaeon]|nr:hypothetical protein [Thermoplasmata archaeon]